MPFEPGSSKKKIKARSIVGGGMSVGGALRHALDQPVRMPQVKAPSLVLPKLPKIRVNPKVKRAVDGIMANLRLANSMFRGK